MRCAIQSGGVDLTFDPSPEWREVTLQKEQVQKALSFGRGDKHDILVSSAYRTSEKRSTRAGGRVRSATRYPYFKSTVRSRPITVLFTVSPASDSAVAPRSDILTARLFRPCLPPGTETAAMIGRVSTEPCPPL
jgi:hypothetical protein